MKRFINPVPQYFLNNGDLASSGFLHFYENGSTTTRKDTYNAPDGVTKNLNPVPLSGAGRVPSIFGEGLYTVECTDNDGVQLWLRHDIEFSGTEGQFSDWSAVVSYDLNDIVRYTDGYYYKSDVVSNIGNNPSTATTKWSRIAFIETFNSSKAGGYDIGSIVDSGGYLYRSNANDNTNTPPHATWDNLTFNNSIVGNFSVSATTTTEDLTVTDAATIGGALSVTGLISSDTGIEVPNSSSANPLVLDYYIESTFTPVLAGTSTAGSGTYTAQVGRQTRIGNIVFVAIELAWTAHTGTGDMEITGLGYTSLSALRQALTMNYSEINIGGDIYQGGAQVNVSTNTIRLVRSLNGGGGVITGIPMDTSGSVIVSGFYFV